LAKDWSVRVLTRPALGQYWLKPPFTGQYKNLFSEGINLQNCLFYGVVAYQHVNHNIL